MAFARVDLVGWARLPDCSREDFLIDAHAALTEADKASRRAPPGSGDMMVCMRREQADAYIALFRCAEDTLKAIAASSAPDLRRLKREREAILVQLRAMTSAEG
jgi:hypothetical protein